MEQRCKFTVWAPHLREVTLKIVYPQERIIPMEKDEKGYWHITADGTPPGTRYLYRLPDGRERPDPASHFQPLGVHGPSQVVDHAIFAWNDREWPGIPISRMIIYELHVGVFTHQGTFEAIIPRLDELKGFGINAVEIMPVAQFPGERNWGYDGAFPFAVHTSYGGTEEFKRLINECHLRGMAVILDVVYNHLGPEGNYLRDFAPYFNTSYHTVWGDAINLDGPYSDEVRNFFIYNALFWFKHYHIDALRLDAVHALFDMSAEPFLSELAGKIRDFSEQEGRQYYLIAESDKNDSRIVRSGNKGGYGLDAQWCDDFHHALHALLTNEKQGYYIDFGKLSDLTKSIREGFVFTGDYSEFRKRSHGNASSDISPAKFIVFSQNHDQIGNRMSGERLSMLLDFESLKLSAGTVLLSPYIPLLFMGEEYGEKAPFLYFISHSDPDLIDSVRKGRKEEFRAFEWGEEPPDPQSEKTFYASKIDWEQRNRNEGRVLFDYYRTLINLRKEIPALACHDRKTIEVWWEKSKRIVFMKRRKQSEQALCIFNFGEHDAQAAPTLLQEEWTKRFDSAEKRWNGPGSLLPKSLQPDDHLLTRRKSVVLYTGKK